MEIILNCPSFHITARRLSSLPPKTTILQLIASDWKEKSSSSSISSEEMEGKGDKEDEPFRAKKHQDPKSKHQGQIIAATVNQKLADMDQELTEGNQVSLLTFADALGKYVFWHSSAHILAQAIITLYPKAVPTIGPPIENGFYYDFANLAILESDLEKINSVARKILKDKPRFKKTSFVDTKEALQHFENNPYKCSIIEELDKKKQQLTAYRQGDFFDLCRGPHLVHAGYIQGFQATKMSGAYWRGDASKEQLTRVYGISFPSGKELKTYLFQLEEAKKRDHRILAKKLDLFSFHKHSPGMPFFHPAGLTIFQQLIEFSRELQTEQGYLEMKTPHMLRRELWETSGHWENYQENMYIANVLDEGVYAIKPMNCPGCMTFFRGRQYSYRQLPLRISEFGLVHRHEASGALSGLFRVRSFHQDDAHIFVAPAHIRMEIKKIIELADHLYATFALSTHLELSTRPKESIGDAKDWEITTSALEQALKDCKKDYKVNLGDGAFYGPKIDFHIRDCLGRTWQCGTIQLDMSLPQRFDLTYIDENGDKARPIVIHRALLGSVERFMAIILEHFFGRLPLWLSPVQLIFLPVHESHIGAAQNILEKIVKEMHPPKHMPLRAEIDDSHETLGKKIRLAQSRQINYMLVIGDQEASSEELTIRVRESKQTCTISVSEFAKILRQEIESRSPQSLVQTQSALDQKHSQ